MSINETKDVSVENYRNSVITVSDVVTLQNLPNNVVRLNATGSGTTLIYIWDSNGRKTYKVIVSNFAQSSLTNLRPGYNPQGTEFIYHTGMNNQVANGKVISPFWNHDFSASIPVNQKNEWRTLVSATTNPNGLTTGRSFAPFSSSTYPSQLLTYYRTPSLTAAIGDINYNPGVLSITSFPLRGGSFELYQNGNMDQLEVFAGENRPQTRNEYIFNKPSSKLYGFSGAKEIFPNVILKSSFVYLDQPSNVPTFFGQPAVPGLSYKNDFVADVALEAHPLTDEITMEGEFGRSSDDNSERALVEYAPYWGRLMLSYKRIGANYVNPASFFLQKNYRETNFISDYRATRKLSLIFNYQLGQFGADTILQSQKSTINRFILTSLYQANESTGYLTSGTFSHSASATAPQNNERLEFTYQKNFKETGDQVFAQFFQQYQKNGYLTQYTQRMGGGSNLRYAKKISPGLNADLQTTFQLNKVQSTFLSASNFSNYLETSASWGPSVTYTLNKKVFSGGLYENFTFKDNLKDFTHFILPYGSAYYTPSQALSVGTRVSFNIDPTSNYSYLSALVEFIYRFGSRVTDTLVSSFKTTGKVRGVVFEDENNDGEYQPTEKLVTGAWTVLNTQVPKKTSQGIYEYKVISGENKVMVILPNEFKNYQFVTTNPTSVDVYNGENRTVNFGINRRIPVYGKVVVREANATSNENDYGFVGARIEITGDNYKDTVVTSPSGIFNTSVPKPGKYKARLLILELPMGYKSIGAISTEFVAQEGAVTKLEPITLSAKRLVVGRIFIDANGNGTFDEDDTPVGGIKIQIGNVTTQSEEDGSFSISTLNHGVYKLKIQQATYKNFKLNLPNENISIPDAGTIQLSIPYQK